MSTKREKGTTGFFARIRSSDGPFINHPENASLSKSNFHNGDWPEKLVNLRNTTLIQGKRKRISTTVR